MYTLTRVLYNKRELREGGREGTRGSGCVCTR